jgi:hypothetical protein
MHKEEFGIAPEVRARKNAQLLAHVAAPFQIVAIAVLVVLLRDELNQEGTRQRMRLVAVANHAQRRLADALLSASLLFARLFVHSALLVASLLLQISNYGLVFCFFFF